MQQILAWLEDRTGYREILHTTVFKLIPGGARWRYVWGTTLIFTFWLQMLTGICLWMAYSPGATSAWESVFYIQHTMVLGWLVRGIHHFAAQAMIVLMVLHLMQVVIYGAYQAPREVNFWLGLVLLQIVAVMGVTGYLLPWDQKGYSATQVVTGIIGATPLIGPSLQELAQGGTQNGHLNITRFFALHTGVLPAALMAVLGLHIYVYRRHGLHTGKHDPSIVIHYWPDQFLRDAVACLTVLMVVIGNVFYWGGADLSAPADAAEAYSAARPEWYYLFLFKFLSLPWVARVGAVTGLGESFGAVVVPGMVMGVLALMPFISRIRYGHQFNVAFLWVVVGIAGVLTGMAVHSDWIADDATGRDFRKAVQLAHRDAERSRHIALSDTGIPPEGAGNLLRNDPLTQGPRLFQTYCINCHQPEEMKSLFKEPAVAPELVDPRQRDVIRFASREWTRDVLVKFEEQFASLKATTGEHSEAAEAILGGSMKDWSESNGPKLLEAENAADFTALVEFIYAQSNRLDALPPTDPIVMKGQEIFTTGKLTKGSIDACIDCHAMRPLVIQDGKKVFSEDALSSDLFPDLTGYGETEWLKKMISEPHKLYAGDSGNNAMPAFSTQLTEGELDLISRWLSGDYYRGPVETGAASRLPH